jgi:nicotinate-nucleotide pyrophosphorylase (carboxylating)
MWTNVLDRQKLVKTAYQKGKALTVTNSNYIDWLGSFFDKEYNTDFGAGDVTSNAVLPENKPRTAMLTVKGSGVIAGIEEVNWFLRKHRLNVKVYKKDGEEVLRGDTILKLYGKQKDILATERIALNVLQRMSGIATETKHLTDLLNDYHTQIAATRKTLLRYLDKKAVYLGGGLTHRFGLWDSILIKDNHLEVLKSEGIPDYIEVAIVKASAFAEKVGFIEIEVTSHEEALEAAKIFKILRLKTPCRVMLDNMLPTKIEQTLETLREKILYDYVLFEASGEITPKNILEYAKSGIDVASVGYLTHSVNVLDMSLEMTI